MTTYTLTQAKVSTWEETLKKVVLVIARLALAYLFLLNSFGNGLLPLVVRPILLSPLPLPMANCNVVKVCVIGLALSRFGLLVSALSLSQI